MSPTGDFQCVYCGHYNCTGACHVRVDQSWHWPPPPTADIATRVAADIFGRWASTWADNLDIPDEFATDAADDSVRLGRIFAEAVAKEGK